MKYTPPLRLFIDSSGDVDTEVTCDQCNRVTSMHDYEWIDVKDLVKAVADYECIFCGNGDKNE